MSKPTKIIIFLLILISITILVYFYINYRQKDITISKNTTPNPQTTEIISTKKTTTTTKNASNKNSLSIPINEFSSRITKKPFGIYISPENSPIKPERFSGYHTGVDIEYEDADYDVPVYAINDSEVIYSDFVSGYGGVVILKTKIDNISRSILYGHLDPESLPKVGDSFKKSDQIAILGEGYTKETDNERKHLHFAILANDRIDFKGYVNNNEELKNWIDPQTLNIVEK